MYAHHVHQLDISLRGHNYIYVVTMSWPRLMLQLQVRWYSFQFLMEELAEEFQEMHVALTALLIKLPDGVIKLT